MSTSEAVIFGILAFILLGMWIFSAIIGEIEVMSMCMFALVMLMVGFGCIASVGNPDRRF